MTIVRKKARCVGGLSNRAFLLLMFQTMFNIGYSLIKDKQITCESWVAVWPGFDDGLRGIGLLRGEGHFVGIVTDRAPDDAEGEQGDQGDQER